MFALHSSIKTIKNIKNLLTCWQKITKRVTSLYKNSLIMFKEAVSSILVTLVPFILYYCLFADHMPNHVHFALSIIHIVWISSRHFRHYCRGYV